MTILDIHQQELRRKSDLHISRKIWHLTGVGLLVVFFNLLSTKAIWILVILGIVGIVPLDYLRRRNSDLNRFVLKIIGPLMRQHEFSRLTGLSWLLLGFAVVMFLYDRHIVNVAMLFLAFGDPVASYFGIRFGKDKIIGNKTLQGTMAAFGVCTLVAATYYYYNNIMLERVLIVAPLSGIIGAASELVPVGKMDDNFTFPVISATCLWLLFELFGGIAL